jgi:DNA-binding NarL/FixJ family response regulator
LQGCRRILEDAGIVDLLETRDAVSGYELYRDHRPDMVIIDLVMQGDGLGGLSLIRRIREHDRHARILVLSMHSDPLVVAPPGQTVDVAAIVDKAGGSERREAGAANFYRGPDEGSQSRQ